jgi:hypothetical protein
MIDKDKLAWAALTIARELGAAEEWENPARRLEEIAEILHDAGLPAVDSTEPSARAYWDHMSVEDLLEPPGPETPTLSLSIDASLASPETIDAIFRGFNGIIHGGQPPSIVPPDYYGRSADV